MYRVERHAVLCAWRRASVPCDGPATGHVVERRTRDRRASRLLARHTNKRTNDVRGAGSGVRAVTAERAIFGDLRRARDFARMIRTSYFTPSVPSPDSPSTFFVDGRSIPHSEDPRDPVAQPETQALARARARARARLGIREVTKVTRCLFSTSTWREGM